MKKKLSGQTFYRIKKTKLLLKKNELLNINRTNLQKCCQKRHAENKTEETRNDSHHNLPFSSGAFLYFSKRFTAIASKRTLAAGYSFSTSHISFLLKTNKSL